MSDQLIQQLKALPVEEQNSWLDAYLVNIHRRERIPQHMHLVLTPHCNLFCKMCFVHSSNRSEEERVNLLNTTEWYQIINEALELGVSSITLTGGEAMLRADYKDIYSYAYDKGFKIFIITNGTLIDQDMVDFLKKRPPEKINMTIYGFSEDTYERNCGNKYAFSRVLRAVDLIEEARLRLEIQTTVTREMIEDFPAIFEFARDRGHEFKFDYILHPSELCSLEKILELSVTREEMDRMIHKVKDIGIFDTVKANKAMSTDKVVKKGMLCGAGKNVFQIDWQGRMQLCTVCEFINLFPLRDGLKNCWNKLTQFAQNIPQIEECQTCEYRVYCKQCIGLHYADMQEFGVISPRLCWKYYFSTHDHSKK